MPNCLSCGTCVPYECHLCKQERCSWFEDPCPGCGLTRAELADLKRNPPPRLSAETVERLFAEIQADAAKRKGEVC